MSSGWKQNILGVTLLLSAFSAVPLMALLPREVAREILLPIERQALNDSDYQVVVLFAGYPGCGDYCPTALWHLDRVQDALAEQGVAGQAGVVFLNILLDSPEAESMAYAQAFNPDFLGFSLVTEERSIIYDTLALTSGYDMESVMAHQGTSYLFNRSNGDWVLEKTYMKLPPAESIAADIFNLIKVRT